jgi:hypothetical protein
VFRVTEVMPAAQVCRWNLLNCIAVNRVTSVTILITKGQ